MKKKMKIWVMMQTHTDIGYTDRQEKIVRYHIDYLKQAIQISESIASGEKPEWGGFVWNNETYWIIEKFIEATDSSWHDRLIQAVKRNHIQLTGNYLNVTDLVDSEILGKFLKKAQKFGKDNQVRIDSAISMDINGWSWAYADKMIDAGINKFYTCIHNHHGFVPFERKHHPFYWVTPTGKKILVWNGDVYNQGNVSRLTPDVEGQIIDGVFQVTVHISEEQLEHAKEWLDDYVESVKLQGYEYDFLPLMTKGILVDNAPPNPYIMQSIKAFNDRFSDEYEIEMIGLNDFFDRIESMKLEIPEYSGDWTDWWSDGFASTPRSLKLYRDAQRIYRQLLAFQEHTPLNQDKLKDLEYNLMMYSEHTWGYITSVSEPWNKMTGILDARNELFASKAHLLAYELWDDVCEVHGEFLKATGRPLLYKVVNPYPYNRMDRVKIYVNWWDEYLTEKGYQIIDAETKEVIPHQEIRVDEKLRREIHFHVEVKSNSSRKFQIVSSPKRNRRSPIDPMATRDARYDFISPYLDNKIQATQFHLETPFVRIEWEKDYGITKWMDLISGKSMISTEKEEPLLTPIYEIAPIESTYQFAPTEYRQIRNDFGRNRKLFSSERVVGRLINSKVLANGPLFARVELKYELAGTSYAVIQLTAYHDEPRVDISFQLGKDHVWDPESLYLAMPWSTNEEETFWIDKCDLMIRPRVDQLPKTTAQFYTLFKGFAFVGKKNSIVVSSPTVPLIYMGTLKPGIARIHDGKHKNTDLVYSWMMNNYWETNFATSLSGFYEFTYSVTWGNNIKSKEDVMNQLTHLYYSLPAFQSK